VRFFPDARSVRFAPSGRHALFECRHAKLLPLRCSSHVENLFLRVEHDGLQF